MAYPVSITVEPALTSRNRLTTAFRVILAIPHIILVGGLGIGLASRSNGATTFGGEGGILGAVAVILAIVSWFTIVFGATHIPGIRQFTSFYMRWRVRALAYLMLLEDAYPPFGDGTYPAMLTVADAALPRRRLSVAFRIFLAIPHMIVLTLVLFAWYFTTVCAWFSILFTGRYPRAFYDFGVGVLRWRMRFDAYLLLMVDEYPPFSLSD